MDGATYYLEKARQCRRLVQAITDAQAIKSLSALAEEFDAKARAMEASDQTSGLRDEEPAESPKPTQGNDQS